MMKYWGNGTTLSRRKNDTDVITIYINDTDDMNKEQSYEISRESGHKKLKRHVKIDLKQFSHSSRIEDS